MFFVDASREFEPGSNQNVLREADLDKIVGTYRQRQSVDKYAYLATFEEIEENDFNLNIPRYVDTFEEEEEIDIAAVQAEIGKIEAELAVVEEKMKGFLAELALAEFEGFKQR